MLNLVKFGFSEIFFVTLRVEMTIMRKFIIFSLLAVLFCSCGEYQKVLKSTDYNYKFEFAKQAFEQKRYVQAATLFKDCSTVFKGTDKAEESLYLLALSNYENLSLIHI